MSRFDEEPDADPHGECAAEIARLTAERDALRERVRVLSSALNAMLTHMGMDEDEWNRPTFEQARKALSQ